MAATPTASASADAAFRIVELVSLLLPIVLVVLQFTVRYYRRDETGSPAVRQAIVLIAIGVAGITTVGAGFFAVSFLSTAGYATLVGFSLQLLQVAVVAFAVPILVILLLAFSELRGDFSIRSRLRNARSRIQGFAPASEEPNPADPNDEPDSPDEEQSE